MKVKIVSDTEAGSVASTLSWKGDKRKDGSRPINEQMGDDGNDTPCIRIHAA